MLLIRQLLYKEKKLDDFDIDSDTSIFKIFFDLLLTMDGTKVTDMKVEKTNYRHQLTSMSSSVVGVFGEQGNKKEPKVIEKDVSLNDIPYHIIRYALTTNPFYRFNNIHHYCPNLKSSNEFVEDNAYLGGLEITFKGTQERLESITHHDYLLGVQGLLSQIEKEIKANSVEYEGSEFFYKPIREVFGTKPVTFPS